MLLHKVVLLPYQWNRITFNMKFTDINGQEHNHIYDYISFVVIYFRRL